MKKTKKGKTYYIRPKKVVKRKKRKVQRNWWQRQPSIWKFVIILFCLLFILQVIDWCTPDKFNPNDDVCIKTCNDLYTKDWSDENLTNFWEYLDESERYECWTKEDRDGRKDFINDKCIERALEEGNLEVIQEIKELFG